MKTKRIDAWISCGVSFAALATLLVVLGSMIRTACAPHPSAKAPAVRYPGYTINAKAIHNAKLFTVLISAEGFGGISRGTGVLIDSTHVLTCAHVALHGNEETLVYFYPGYVLAKGKTVFADKSADLAILEIDVPAHSPVWPVFQEKHFDGQPITIMGNILGSMKWFVGYGIISGESGPYLFTDGLVKGGDSGGPWINYGGEILALSDWGLERKGKEVGISGGISAKTINTFLKAWKSPSLFDLLQQL